VIFRGDDLAFLFLPINPPTPQRVTKRLIGLGHNGPGPLLELPLGAAALDPLLEDAGEVTVAEQAPLSSYNLNFWPMATAKPKPMPYNILKRNSIYFSGNKIPLKQSNAIKTIMK